MKYESDASSQLSVKFELKWVDANSNDRSGSAASAANTAIAGNWYFIQATT